MEIIAVEIVLVEGYEVFQYSAVTQYLIGTSYWCYLFGRDA